MEEKNFIIFMVLTILLVMVWFNFMAPKPPQKEPGQQYQAGNTVRPPDAAGGSTLASPPPPAALAGSTAPAPVALAPEHTVTVRTDVYEVEFTNRGAAPKHWLLRDYPAEKCFPYVMHVKWPPLEKRDCEAEAGKLTDLVDQSFAPRSHPFMARLEVGKARLDYHAPWEIEGGEDLTLTDGLTVGEVSFISHLDDGRAVRKIYRFGKSRYDVNLRFLVEGEPPASARVDLTLLYEDNQELKGGVPRWNFNGALAQGLSKVEQIDPDDVVKKGFIEVNQVEWAGFTDDYFLSAVLARPDTSFSYVIRHEKTEGEDKKSPHKLVGWVRVKASPEDLAQGVAADLTIFMGPKDKRILIPVRDSLKESIDYGMLELLVKPLLAALRYINLGVNNYGVSIIILTVILRMAMFPLTRKSQKAMKQMQKLQPEIAKIKEKYPDDRAKQNEETQLLWKRYKINPAMGCLPMLLQFPFFFAFYKALLISIELRQAPFVGWILDLSARDPLYIWPVAMGATQLITQKMTPTQMDPTQQKIFLIMPIVFTYILRDFPAGLLIYWTVQNIVGVAQQIYVNRQPD